MYGTWLQRNNAAAGHFCSQSQDSIFVCVRPITGLEICTAWKQKPMLIKCLQVLGKSAIGEQSQGISNKQRKDMVISCWNLTFSSSEWYLSTSIVLENDGEFGGILWPAEIILKFRIILNPSGKTSLQRKILMMLSSILSGTKAHQARRRNRRKQLKKLKSWQLLDLKVLALEKCWALLLSTVCPYRSN